MTNKQKHSDMEHEREYYVSLIYTPKEMSARWKRIGYTPPKGGWQRRLFAFFLILFISSCGKKYKYEEGMHWRYKIICENGFVYKATNKGIIQILNTDGKPLKCGQKAY